MIYRYELKKLLTSPAVLVFVMLCLVWNCAYVAMISFGEISYDRNELPPNVFETFDAVGVGESYIARQHAMRSIDTDGLAGVDVPIEADEPVVADGMASADGSVDADRSADANVPVDEDGSIDTDEQVDENGLVARLYRDMYADLQLVTDEKAKGADAVSVYYGPILTKIAHDKLFGGVMRWLLMEGMVLAILLSILSLGWEQINRTDALVYSSKVGRKLIHHKIGASLTAGLSFFLVIAAVTLGLYFTINDYSGVWLDNVSSGNNYIKDLVAGIKPFTTWQDFTVLGYLFAHLGISTGLVACASLMGTAAGLLAKNSYVGFLGVVLVNGVCAVIPMVVSGTVFVKYLFVLTPLQLWSKTTLWFTDGLMDVLFKNFETLGLCLSLVVTVGVLVIGMVRFGRRDLG